MRVMAVDLGDARTGLSVSDESATLAGESWVVQVKSLAGVAQVIADEAVSRGVSVIVVGYPKNMNGTIGPRAEKSAGLAETLRKLCGQAQTKMQEQEQAQEQEHMSAENNSNNSADAPSEPQSNVHGISVVLWDERMTTMSAHRILSDAGKHGKKRKDTVDAVAASVILQSYLDYLKTSQ